MRIVDVCRNSSIVQIELKDDTPHQFLTRLVYMDHRMFDSFAEDYDYDFTDTEFDTDGHTIWEIETTPA